MLIKLFVFGFILLWVVYAFYTVINNKRKGISNCNGTCSSCVNKNCNDKKVMKFQKVNF